MAGQTMEGSAGWGGGMWKPNGCDITWKAEITLVSEFPRAAPGGTVTLASTCVGLTTQTLFTRMSEVPKPTLTWPWTKLAFEAVMETIDEMPAGKVAGVTEVICG